MIIRKLFKFENAHIVRNCSSDRCKRSIHGHSYKVEVLLTANQLDHGQMVYDFGLMKGVIKDLIDSFDHAITFWDQDDQDYLTACRQFSARWISLPVSPSAEQFSRIFFFLVREVLKSTKTANGEGALAVHSVIVHETDTGYAQCFADDVDNPQMGALSLARIEFSSQIQAEWSVPDLWNNLCSGHGFENPKVDLQVKSSILS